jgi:hypothetical protein
MSYGEALVAALERKIQAYADETAAKINSGELAFELLDFTNPSPRRWRRRRRRTACRAR